MSALTAKLLLRIDEVAAALDCSERHVRNLIDEGKLDTVVINTDSDPVRHHVRVKRESVERFIGLAKLLLGVNEAAGGCSERHVRNLIDKGRLETVVINGVRRAINVGSWGRGSWGSWGQTYE